MNALNKGLFFILIRRKKVNSITLGNNLVTETDFFFTGRWKGRYTYVQWKRWNRKSGIHQQKI